MKRSIIAVAAILLLASSATYASPLRHPRRFTLGPVLFWFGLVHHVRMERPCYYGPVVREPMRWQRPPWLRERPRYGIGWHWGWQRGQHNGWDQNDNGRGGRDGHDRRGDDGHEHGPRGDRG